MFVDLDGPLNASSLLSASELLVPYGVGRARGRESPSGRVQGQSSWSSDHYSGFVRQCIQSNHCDA